MLEYEHYLVAQGLAANTIRGKLSNLRVFSRRVENILCATQDDIVAYTSEHGLKPTTLWQRFMTLDAFYNWQLSLGHLLSHPMAKLACPQLKKKLPINIMTQHETDLLLGVYSDQKDNPLSFMKRTMLEVMYSCSLRCSEVVGLQLADYDWGLKLLTVRGTKNKCNRLLPVGRTAARMLETYISEFRPVTERKEIFLQMNGNKIHSGHLNNLVKAARKISGIRTKATSHSLRKSSATHMLKNGAPMRSVQSLLGHQALSSTVIYTKVYPKDLFRILAAKHPREREKRLRLPKLGPLK